MFNIVTFNFFNLFYSKILDFLIIIIYYNINKYQNNKIFKILFNKKII